MKTTNQKTTTFAFRKRLLSQKTATVCKHVLGDERRAIRSAARLRVSLHNFLGQCATRSFCSPLESAVYSQACLVRESTPLSSFVSTFPPIILHLGHKICLKWALHLGHKICLKWAAVASWMAELMI